MRKTNGKRFGLHQRGLACLLEILGACCDCAPEDKFETGCMVLGFGHHEVTVATACEPKDVLISANVNVGDTPVCQGDINMVGCAIKNDGFVLYADIKTNTAEICWTVEY